LLTDFGLKDNYVGVMKAVLLKINPRLNLVDITHEVASHDIFEASFLLLKSFKFFPKGTVFLVVVDPGVGSQRAAIAIKTENYYFVGPDNGVLSLAARSDGIKKIISLTNRKFFLKELSSTFHGRDIFSPCAAYISKRFPLREFGKALPKIKSIGLPGPLIKKNRLYGEIIFVDKFGNLVTNITRDIFLKFIKKRKFSLHIKSKAVKKLYRFYRQAEGGEPFLCEGSFGFLEISLNNRSAKTCLRAKVRDKFFVDIG